MVVRTYLHFYGSVQGVGFRWKAMQAARMYRLTGWVRNLYDGTVEMEIQGNHMMIESVLQVLKEDRWIRIERVERMQIPNVEEESEFVVRG